MKNAAQIVDLVDQEMRKTVRRKSSAAAALGLAMYRAAIEETISAATVSSDGTESVSVDELRRMLTQVESAQWAVFETASGGN
jgi:peptidoglycan hydrolase-like amidase